MKLTFAAGKKAGASIAADLATRKGDYTYDNTFTIQLAAENDFYD